MAKKVPVTSVTPASKVKETSKAQQSRTRNLVMGIAAATPVGRAAKVATTAVKASNAAKTAKANKTLATPKSAVKVLPRKTAPKTDLSSRGAKPTKSQRSERASDLYFNKAEGRWEGEYLTQMTGLRGPKGVTSQSARGQGERSLRKTAAIKKEAKPVVKINSQRNLKKK